MSTRQLLHEIVDNLPERDLITAVRVLKGLQLAPDPVPLALDNAPRDDEPDDDDFDGGLSEARADMQTGRTTSTEELLRRLGIDE